MTLGFEQIHRLDSGGSVNFLVLTNLSISGMNQGSLFPTGHIMMGYQFYDSWYVGAGPFYVFMKLNPHLMPK